MGAARTNKYVLSTKVLLTNNTLQIQYFYFRKNVAMKKRNNTKPLYDTVTYIECEFCQKKYKRESCYATILKTLLPKSSNSILAVLRALEKHLIFENSP